MAEAGILRRVVPEAGDGQGLAALARAEKRARVAPGWMRRLRLLTAAEVREALRLSNAETEALRRIGAALACADPPAALAARFGAEAARDAILIRAAGGEALLAGWQEEVARGAAAEFPLTAADLMPPLEPGPTLGAALGRLREAWLAADLRLDRQALLALL
jgi:poly(A) polymerase